MPSFARSPDGRVRVSLDPQEADVLRGLVDEMRTLLAGRARHKTDPVLLRLFPEAYEDEQDQRDYAELVGEDLERHKVGALDDVAHDLGPAGTGAEVDLSGDGLRIWLATLTDLRLAIGIRLNVDEDRMSQELDPKDRDAPAMALLHWLGWVQDSIIRELSDA